LHHDRALPGADLDGRALATAALGVSAEDGIRIALGGGLFGLAAKNEDGGQEDGELRDPSHFGRTLGGVPEQSLRGARVRLAVIVRKESASHSPWGRVPLFLGEQAWIQRFRGSGA
jgi:hypothetical protein